jgi:hypothetical protein
MLPGKNKQEDELIYAVFSELQKFLLIEADELVSIPKLQNGDVNLKEYMIQIAKDVTKDSKKDSSKKNFN